MDDSLSVSFGLGLSQFVLFFPLSNPDLVSVGSQTLNKFRMYHIGKKVKKRS